MSTNKQLSLSQSGETVPEPLGRPPSNWGKERMAGATASVCGRHMWVGGRKHLQ